MPDIQAAEEIWRRVGAYPDYEVSNLGRVRSWRGRAGHARQSPVIMQGYIDDHGYRRVMLRKPGSPKPYARSVHRLVAVAFIPNPLDLPDVAHEHGAQAGDAVGNLRWSTHRDNQMDMRRHGTMQDGERSVTAKLTARQVEEIRAERQRSGRGSQVRLAEAFGISVGQVSRIVNGIRWASTYGAQNG